MKSFYAFKSILTACCIILFVQQSTAQTTLTKGDIAFTGYSGHGATAGTDEFSFVLLTPISNGTNIKFTENGWLRTSATTGSFRTGEATLQYTSGLALAAGTEIRIVCATTPTATYGPTALSAGTVSILAATEGNGQVPALSANGDQIIAYQGTAASPTFISAIHMNVYSVAVNPAPGVPGGDPVTTTTTDWDGSLSTAFASGLPSGAGSNFLTNGVDAIWIPGSIVAEVDNARFNCTGPLTTVAQIRAAIYNVANWTTSDNLAALPSNSGCNFLGILPIDLISFTGKNNANGNTLTWQTGTQLNFSHFELERSFDGSVYNKINQQNIQTTNSYTYLDDAIIKLNFDIAYYRLKLVDIDGQYKYSSVVKINNAHTKAWVVSNLSNPFQQKVQFNLSTKKPSTISLQLLDVNGKLITQKQLVINGSNNIITIAENNQLPAGMYILKLSNEQTNSTYKIIKQ